jgi:translation initiation factor IF-3
MDPYVVNYATFFETRLIDDKGNYLPTVHIRQAKEMAKTANLDLVCFNNPVKDQLALCKIIDWPKFKYQLAKADKKNKQHKTEIKEMHFAPVISEHDVGYKVKQIIEFLKDNMEVIITMRFKGSHRKIYSEGEKIINDIAEQCKPYSTEKYRKKDNDNISIRLIPIKNN